MLTARKSVKPTGFRSTIPNLKIVITQRSSRFLIPGKPFSTTISRGYGRWQSEGRQASCNDAVLVHGGQYVLRPYSKPDLKGFSALQTRRSASYWRRPSGSCSNDKKSIEDQLENWWRKWEKQHVTRFEDLAKRIEQDPYDALFGPSNRWLRWAEEGPEKPKVCKSSHVKEETGGSPKRPPPNVARTTSQSLSKDNPTNIDQNSRSQPHGPQVPIAEQSEYEIDPITLRKVPRQTVACNSSATWSSDPPVEDAISIPVKKFKFSSSQSQTEKPTKIPSTQSDVFQSTSSQNWLAQEGFRSEEATRSCHENVQSVVESKAPKTPKIESALDRHARNKRIGLQSQQTLGTNTEIQENRKDDVDLIRSSDVRASAGLRGRPVKEGPSQKLSRQRVLEESFDNSSAQLESKLAQEIAQSPRKEPEAPRTQSEKQSINHKSLDSRSLKRLELDPGSANENPILKSTHINSIRAKLVPMKTSIDRLNEDYAFLKRRLLDEKHRIEETHRKHAATKASRLLEQEIKTQKHAMQAIESSRVKGDKGSQQKPNSSREELRGEGDVASNIHEFVNRPTWYKRKAPHAQCELDAKFHRLAKEKALVREVRGIYEDTYGTIDTQHRQPSNPTLNMSEDNTDAQSVDPSLTNPVTQDYPLEVKSTQRPVEGAANTILSGSASRRSHPKARWQRSLEAFNTPSDLSRSSNKPEQASYRILAYDSSAQKVNSARISSQVPFRDEIALTPLQTFQKLSNPGKFLPHLSNLHNKGYDVVSGGTDMVVLKKVREPIVSKDDYCGRPNPIDGTTTPEVSTGNFASPTGFVNHNPVIPPEEQEQEQGHTPPRSTNKVRREEDVFSGTNTQKWREHRRISKKNKRRASRRGAIKRMLLTGTLTAAACYTTGMIYEAMYM